MDAWKTIFLTSLMHIILSFSLAETESERSTSDSFRSNPNLLVNEPGHLQKFGAGRPTHSVDEIHGFPSVREFFTDYVLQAKPVKMVGAMRNSRPVEAWTDEYFLSLDIPNTNEVLVETKKKEDRKQYTVDMHFQEFVRVYNSTDQFMVSQVPDFLGKDIQLPPPLQCEEIYDNNLIDAVMWFSSGGTKSVVHTDSVDNINCLYWGEKEFIMVDPQKYRDMVDMDHPEGAYSGIDVDRMDYTKYPGLAEVEYHLVNLSAGDCLFLPYKWIHQVRSYNRNIAVNVWWDYHSNKDVDLEKCTSPPDPNLTLDKVMMHGFKSVSASTEAIRDHFLDYSRKGPLDFDRTLELIVDDVQFMNAMDAGRGYSIPIKQIFNILDKDSNGLVDSTEIKTAGNEDMARIQEEMQRFEAIMEVLEERWREKNESPEAWEAPPDDWEPDQWDEADRDEL